MRHIFLSPLAYLLGIEGAALLRGIREGFADREFVEARISEVRSLLDDADLAPAGGMAKPDGFSVQDAYAAWASTYDQPNSMIEVEQPVVRRILNGLPVGVALDAACGTGRHAEYLAKLGHRVLSSDSSPEMLSVARAKLPNADLCEAPLDQLPFEDHSVDIVVCALALSYVRDMAPVMAEFARVLQSGGHLVISDAHIVLSYLRPMLAQRPGSDGIATLLPEYHRPLSAYLAAALPLGFEVRRCAEPNRPRAASGTYVMPATEESPTHVSWELLGRCPEAAATVLEDSPILVVWHFQLK